MVSIVKALEIDVIDVEKLVHLPQWVLTMSCLSNMVSALCGSGGGSGGGSRGSSAAELDADPRARFLREFEEAQKQFEFEEAYEKKMCQEMGNNPIRSSRKSATVYGSIKLSNKRVSFDSLYVPPEEEDPGLGPGKEDTTTTSLPLGGGMGGPTLGLEKPLRAGAGTSRMAKDAPPAIKEEETSKQLRDESAEYERSHTKNQTLVPFPEQTTSSGAAVPTCSG